MQGWLLSCALGLLEHPRATAGSRSGGVIASKALLCTENEEDRLKRGAAYGFLVAVSSRRVVFIW